KRVLPVPADRDQLRQIVAGLTEGVILIERDKSIHWANAAACAMHGVADVAALGRNAADYRKRFALRYRNHHAVPAASYPIDRVLAGESFNDVVVEVTAAAAPDEKWVHHLRSLVITDEQGKPDCFILFVVDVTEWASAEQRFEKAFNANPAPALICRLSDLRFIKVNRGFLDMTGYVADQVIARSVYEIDVLDQSPDRESAIEHLVAGDTIPQTEAELRVAGGGSKLIIVAGQPIELADEPCMLFTFMDLEPRRLAEADLRHSEERFVKAFRMSPVPTLLCSRDDMEITELNEAIAATTGYESEELLGRSVEDMGFLDAGSARTQIVNQLRKAGSLRNVECQVKRKDGAMIDCLVSAETVHIDGSDFVLLAMLEITHRRRTEMELVTAVESVMKDASWFSGPLIEKLANLRRGSSPKQAAELADLTNRERDVLALIGEGLSDKVIAARLRVSPSTVRNHAASLYSKLDIHTRGEAILWARERGFSGTSERAAPRKPPRRN
ncbi:MAG: helix-turn-helix transcriptional regulator, partial [Dokdonella sp.]|uniref:helix-turn-helix transcriptional regulator n=1 Tax=Dokdonella sp. TaxID=2291710 RepID=UPI003266478A